MVEKVKILLIEDDPQDAALFDQLMSTNRYRSFPNLSYTIRKVTSMSEAVEAIEEGDIGVVAVDLLLGGKTPNDILALIERTSRMVPTVALTTEESIDTAIEAIKHGAQDYLVKDRTSADAIDRAIRYAIERRKLIEKQKRIEDELKRSNADLEQYAYVASHDLREPLRMVMNYLELLEKRYKGKQLDATAEQFIANAIDGARRMQEMTKGLLEYARVSSQGSAFEPVDMQGILDAVLSNLAAPISESKATVTHDRLPTVSGDRLQLTQLMQNLIGNAIKFRGEKPPAVHISARKESGEWLFSVRDNGIGIAEQDRERLFDMYQRLHTRDEYPGTGIGLAVARRIVGRHGGRIWFDSEVGKGSTFHFTIPISI